MSFNQSTYSVDEDDGPAQPVLVLSSPSSANITVQMFSIDGSAAGKHHLVKCVNYLLQFVKLSHCIRSIIHSCEHIGMHSFIFSLLVAL